MSDYSLYMNLHGAGAHGDNVGLGRSIICIISGSHELLSSALKAALSPPWRLDSCLMENRVWSRFSWEETNILLWHLESQLEIHSSPNMLARADHIGSWDKFTFLDILKTGAHVAPWTEINLQSRYIWTRFITVSEQERTEREPRLQILARGRVSLG